MRVLFVSSANKIQGGSIIVNNQGYSLSQIGVSITNFYITGNGLKGYLNNIKRLKRSLMSNNFDLIHAHYGLCGLVVFLARCKLPVIISFMGDDILGSNLKNGTKSYVSHLIVLINKFLAKLYYDAVIVKSQEMYGKVYSKKKYLIPNGVDTEKFKLLSKILCRQRLVWNDNKYHLLFMSDPDRPEKNFRLVSRALNQLREKLNFELHLLKGVPHCDVPYYMNASDVCLLSSYHEGSANVIKEAMSCGCTIVSTPVGDVKELFSNVEGCFIASFDSEEYAERILQAIIFSETVKKTLGFQKIRDLGMDSSTIASKIHGIYSELVHSS